MNAQVLGILFLAVSGKFMNTSLSCLSWIYNIMFSIKFDKADNIWTDHYKIVFSEILQG